jgi:hypothetical protein
VLLLYLNSGVILEGNNRHDADLGLRRPGWSASVAIVVSYQF